MMKTMCAVSMLIACMVNSGALAQQKPIPSLEDFNNILTLCAAGSRISLSGEIRGNFNSVYKDKVVDAKNAIFITSADFLLSLPEKDRLTGLQLYHTCVVNILNGSVTASSPTPAKLNNIDLPETIETFGKPLSIKAAALTGNSEIRSFPFGLRASNGLPGNNGSNGGNGANGAGGVGGDGGAGISGSNGSDGAAAGEIRMEADSFTGNLKVLNSGLPGGAGGVGGAGGNGGAGGQGNRSVSGLFDCRSGPGNGGQGGNAGPGGDGGRGGNGGAGGAVILKFKTVTPGSTINVTSDGAGRGSGGEPGQPGAIGGGGPPGSLGGNCRRGRAPGANGVAASAGRKLGDGQDGPSGSIEVTVGDLTSTATGRFSKKF